MDRSQTPTAAGARSVAATPSLPAVGTAPINWNNGDLVGWRPTIPFPAILDEMVGAGYAGTEYGANFPTDPEPLRRALAERGLRLCGAYHALPFDDDERFAAGLPDLDRLLRLLAAAGCRDLIVAFELTPERVALAGRVPADGSAGLSEAQWAIVRRNLTAVGEAAAAHDLRTHLHNHVGTVVESPAEVERLLDLLPPGVVDLCFDAGHYAYGGGDPTAFVERHRDRIGYVHLKDIDPAVLASAREHGLGFREALADYVFCELGRGLVDVPRVVGALVEAGYAGWIVVEQDTSPRPPTESAAANRRYLRDCCGI